MWTLICGYLFSMICIISSFSIKSTTDNYDSQLNHNQLMFNPVRLLIPSDVDYNLLDPFAIDQNLNAQSTIQQKDDNNNYYLKGAMLRDANGEVKGQEVVDGQSRNYQLINHVNYGGITKEDDASLLGDSEIGIGNDQGTINTESSIDHNQDVHLSIGKKRSSVMLNSLGFAWPKANKMDSPRHSLRSSDVSKGFADKSSGSKDNLLVKCFFNGVSCF